MTKRRQGFGKKAVSALLALALLCGFFPSLAVPVQAASWADPYMDQLVAWGVLRGDVAGNLAPNRQITRAEFVTMVNRAFGYTEGGDTPFTDVTSRDWYSDDIGFAYHTGYFKGTSSTTASPTQSLTREEAVVLLCRNLRIPEKKGEALGFSDSRNLAEWSRGYIQAASEMGIASGYTDGSFRPQRAITRGEVSAMLVRAVGNLINRPGETSLGSVYGNLTISVPGVRLRNTVIAGDLYLTGGVGLGDVLLENVSVLGRIVVSGAGEGHQGGSSILLRNVTADNMVVDSMNDQFLTLRAEGDTAIDKTIVRSSALLEDMTAEGLGLRHIETDGEPGLILQLAGNIEEVTNRTPNAVLTMTQGKAAVINMDEEGVGSSLAIENGGRVDVLNLDTATNVTGVGGIAHIQISSDGSTVAQLPDEIIIRPGASANINGEMMDSVTAKESSQEPRLLAGYPRTKNVAATSADTVFSANKRGTVHWAITALADGSATEQDLLEPSGTPGKIIRQGTTAINASNTETVSAISGLTPDGSYYLTAIMTDNRNQRSPLKIYAFSTPDNTVPNFNSGYPYISKITKDSIQITAMPNKNCLLYYAVLPKGSTTPTLDDFKAGAISGNLGYGSIEVLKNSTTTFTANSKTLKELETYDIYLVLVDADGTRNSGVRRLTATTVDGTPPLFLTEPTVNAINPTSVNLLAALNENGVIYWAVVPHGEEYPKPLAGQTTKPALTSDTAKMQVEYGMNCLRSGKVSATANRDVTLNVTGLQGQSSYDLYYMAKDTAGNYTAEVKMITIHTLDNEPPQISQVFNRTSDEEGKEPRPDTDVTIVFSEGVQDLTDRKILSELYATANSTTASETERTNARTQLTNILTRDIELYDKTRYPETKIKAVTREQVRAGNLTGDWICYEDVEVKVNEGRTELIFKNATASETPAGMGNISLSSGNTYFFRIRNITDTSNNADKNVIRPNPQDLPSFTTVFATVRLTQEGITGGKPQTGTGTTAKDVDVHMNFQLHPISAGSVPENMFYDLILWSNQTVLYDVYIRVRNGSAVVTNDPATASLTAAGNGWYKLGNMGATTTDDVSMGSSMTLRARNSTTFQQLNNLKDAYTYEYAISVTQIGTLTDPKDWSQRVDLQVTVPAGPSGNLLNLGRQPTTSNWETYTSQSLDQGGVKAIHNPSSFNIFHQFSDNQAPSFVGNYPTFDSGDTFVNMSIQLKRSAQVYYVLAPIKSVDPEVTIQPYLDVQKNNQVVTPTSSIPPKQGSPDGNFTVDKPNNLEIFLPDPTWDSAIKTGMIQGGTGTTNRMVTGLMSQTTYYALFVIRGDSGVLSPVYCFQFTTQDVNTPTVKLEENSPNVSVTTSTNAIVDWILYANDSLFPMLKHPFETYRDQTVTGYDPKVLFPHLIKTETIIKVPAVYEDDGVTIKVPAVTEEVTTCNPTVLDALLTSMPGSQQSVFDHYIAVDSAAYQEVLGRIQGQITGDVNYAGRGQLPYNPLPANTARSVDCTQYMLPETQYYFLAAARNDQGSIYGFKAVKNVHIPDKEAPEFIRLSTVLDELAGTSKDMHNVPMSNWSNPAESMNYWYSGEITLTFDERIYQLIIGDNIERQLITLGSKTEADKNSAITHIVDVLGTAGQYMKLTCTRFGSTITIKFENVRHNYEIILFDDGWVSDASSNSDRKKLYLTFNALAKSQNADTNPDAPVVDLGMTYPSFTYEWRDR